MKRATFKDAISVAITSAEKDVWVPEVNFGKDDSAWDEFNSRFEIAERLPGTSLVKYKTKKRPPDRHDQ
jgi:hypothetical protein